MAAYQLTKTSVGAQIVRRTSDGAGVPSDPKNRDWIVYLAWLAAGNTPDPDPVPTAAAAVQVAKVAAALIKKGIISPADLL